MRATTDHHQEFQENVMHILDRSHQRYRMKVDNNFIVDSQAAKEGLLQAVSRNSSTSDKDEDINSSSGRIRVAGRRGSRLLL